MLKFARRAFLKAVAGVWGLSYTDQLTMLNPETQATGDPSEPRRIHYSDQHDGMFLARQGSIHASIEIIVYPGHHEPVGIEMSMDGLDMGAALTSEDARELGEVLLIAAKRTE